MKSKPFVRRVVWPLRRRWRALTPRAGILMYHRVATEAVDPWNLCVSPEHFEQQIELLARRRAAVDLGAFAGEDVIDRKGSKLAVTFDDAYRDNLEVALPILERHGVPATIFVISDALGRTREFWWDALCRAVLESGDLPTTLEITLGGHERSFVIDDDSAAVMAPGRWNADREEPRTGRERLYMDLWNAIVVLPPADQDAAVATILLWAGMPVAGPESRRPATREQIAALADHPLVRIGNHTRHHPSLPDHDAARQRDEIAGCQRALEDLAGGPIDRMSYPFGRNDAASRRIIAELGIPVACTSYPAAITRTTPRDQLTRLQVLDQDSESFARWLRDDHALLEGAA
ncbi:polysaccharide deacetylase family protein [Croceibacterium ferulae]|uniref:polysaccharide deacetylase family protein n=1 Tax=Croceibacterium ferulae TaxID=1854641 RepID=UPI0019D4BAED|nr:polysaccharide deacetylase family protein [Croceibacterium ferulae]